MLVEGGHVVAVEVKAVPSSGWDELLEDVEECVEDPAVADYV